MAEFEIAVVGAGLIGAAAARHGAAGGASIVVIGPEEPTDPAVHEGPFASHYDSGRITRHLDASPLWAELAARAIAAYPVIEAGSGIDFHRPVGLLWADRGPRGLSDLAAASKEYDAPLTALTSAEATDRLLWSFSPDHALGFEAAPAGYIDPRRMVRAQLAAAEADGAVIVHDVVERIAPTGDAVRIELRSGELLAVSGVIVAAGVYSTALLRELVELPIVPIAAAVILGEITPDDAAAYEAMPAMIHRIGDEDIVDVYAVPPVRYPDGRWYVKLGAEVLPEVELHSEAAVRQWMTSAALEWAPHLGELLRTLLPDVRFLSTAVRPCVYARTPSRLPFVDQVADRVFVAGGGNGRAAKSADALGALVVDLARSGAWRDPLDREAFRVPH